MDGVKKKDYRIDNIRALAISLVVIGHSIILFDPEWGVYSYSKSCPVLMYIKHYISLVQIPLFISVSGYCYALSSWADKEPIEVFIWKKAKRLLLPFVFISVFWMIPFRLLSHYPRWEHTSYFHILTQVFIGQDSGHLWFLGCLFFIFVIVGLGSCFEKKVSDLSFQSKRHDREFFLVCFVLLSLSAFLSCISSLITPILFAKYWAENLIWFCIGIILNRRKVRFSKKIRILFGISASVLLTCAVFGLHKTKMVCSYIGTFFFICTCFTSMSDRNCALLQFISRNSFGIYLFHSPMLYIVFCYLSWLDPVSIILLNLFFCVIVSILITTLIRKNKHIRFIIGE